MVAHLIMMGQQALDESFWHIFGEINRFQMLSASMA
jgi:hypothetical protein